MLKFMKENGYPVNLTVDTEELEEPMASTRNLFFRHIVYLDGRKIDEFCSKSFQDRKFYCRGYLRALGYEFKKIEDDYFS